MTQKEDKETSEFQDTYSLFQRLDEVSVDCWNVFLATQREGGYAHVEELLNRGDVYFGIFRNICTETEQIAVDTKRTELKKQISIEWRRINHAKTYAPNLNAQASEGLKEGLRKYLLEIGRLREVHKLAARTRRKPDMEKRAKNAARY